MIQSYFLFLIQNNETPFKNEKTNQSSESDYFREFSQMIYLLFYKAIFWILSEIWVYELVNLFCLLNTSRLPIITYEN